MTKHYLTHEGRLVQETPTQSLTEYFRKQRAKELARYRAAVGGNAYLCANIRRNARSWALHYGRLIRKMEIKQ